MFCSNYLLWNFPHQRSIDLSSEWILQSLCMTDLQPVLTSRCSIACLDRSTFVFMMDVLESREGGNFFNVVLPYYICICIHYWSLYCLRSRTLTYNDLSNKTSTFTTDSAPSEQRKKVTLLLYFNQYMDEHLIQGGDVAAAKDRAALFHVNNVFMKKWFRTDKAIVMHLNNGTLQVIDNRIITFCSFLICHHKWIILARLVNSVSLNYMISPTCLLHNQGWHFACQNLFFAGTVVKTGFYRFLPVFFQNHIEFYIIVAFIVYNHIKLQYYSTVVNNIIY